MHIYFFNGKDPLSQSSFLRLIHMFSVLLLICFLFLFPSKIINYLRYMCQYLPSTEELVLITEVLDNYPLLQDFSCN